MVREIESKEIIKVLDILIGKTEATGSQIEDNRRLDNLKVLIDVTNWCMDGLQFAMDSGYCRFECSMREIGNTAQGALLDYKEWIDGLLCDK